MEKSKDFTLTQKARRTCHSILCCTYNCYLTQPAGGGFATAALADDPDDAYLYYKDSFNDMSWTCSFCTSDKDGIWLNQADPAGTIMAILVWVLLLYRALTMTFLAVNGGISLLR
ncbi:hypothetical protein ACA910_013835 [Epithemia clementina (nom. ined.)]